MLPQWFDLAFADRERIEGGVKEALLLQPNISANEFRRFVEGRARAIQNIAAFLVANMPFTEEEDSATRVGELAANTFAYHLADAIKREQLVGVFQAIATSILEHTDAARNRPPHHALERGLGLAAGGFAVIGVRLA